MWYPARCEARDEERKKSDFLGKLEPAIGLEPMTC
jgi:hypothetical protein